MNYLKHTFGPTETIDGVILLKNQHNLSASEALDMRSWYNALNDGQVPKQGDICNIPILEKYEHLFEGLIITREK